MKLSYFEAIATLMGTMIGAGILGIPYVFAKSGVLLGSLVLFIVLMLIIYVHLGFGEIILRTKKKHQISGYAEKYLGKPAKIIMTISSMLIFYFILSAYLLASGQILHQLLGISEIIGSVLFFLVFSSIVVVGLKAIEDSELSLSIIILILVFLFSVFLIPKLNLINLQHISLPNILLPYGVLIFAFYGLPAIPEIAEELGKNKKSLKRCILTGTLLVAFIYLLFATIVVGITGKNTTEVAVLGLSEALGPALLLFGNLFGLIALLTSAIPISLATKEIFNYDLNFSNKKSLVFATILPFIFFLIIKSFSSFSQILNIVGAVFCTVQIILVLFMLKFAKKKSERKPEYSIYSSNFVIGLISLLVIIGMINAII